MNAKRFMTKIPNIDVMRDFFVNTGKFYVPPKRDLTATFCKVFISIILIKTYRKYLLVQKDY